MNDQLAKPLTDSELRASRKALNQLHPGNRFRLMTGLSMLPEENMEKTFEFKPVLDACCGSRMMWMDKDDERVTFVDRRNEDYEIKPDRAYPSGTVIRVRPDVVADFTALPFPDASFWHVVFDPPHIIRNAELGTVTKKYGCLNGDWKAMLAGGFKECFRVLKPHGTLIFKWCETQIPLRDILALTPEKPLYGHKGGQKSVTHWVAFMKQETPKPPLKSEKPA